MVRQRGLEPPRYCYRQPLKLVRLPIPPLPHMGYLIHFSREPVGSQPIQFLQRVSLDSQLFGYE
jgi:hypothetical protein